MLDQNQVTAPIQISVHIIKMAKDGYWMMKNRDMILLILAVLSISLMFIMIVHYTSLPDSIERAQGVMPEIERIKKST